MTPLLLLVAVAIAYGSLYPFEFRAVAVDGALLASLVADWRTFSGPADTVANIGLFGPYASVVALAASGRPRPGRALARHLVTAIAFALILQLAQIWLPARTASLNDVVLNGAGFSLGALTGSVPWLRPAGSASGGGEIATRPLLPLLLLGCWLAFRLFPYVPSLDLQNVKDSLKPLVLDPMLVPSVILHDTVGWTIAGQLLRTIVAAAARPRWFALVIASILAAEVVVIDNVVSASEACGAVLGLLVWSGVFARMPRPPAALAILLAATIMVVGLAPFELRPVPKAMDWLPFHGYLAGSLRHSIVVLLEKSFSYGALLWLVHGTGRRWSGAAIMVAGLAAAVETAQIWFARHSPEVSDPIHVVALAIVFALLSVRRPHAGS